MIGKKCSIVGTDIEDALVVGRRQYVGDMDRFTVRYLIGGMPIEREFQANEISFGDRQAAADVIDIRRSAA